MWGTCRYKEGSGGPPRAGLFRAAARGGTRDQVPRSSMGSWELSGLWRRRCSLPSRLSLGGLWGTAWLQPPGCPPGPGALLPDLASLPQLASKGPLWQVLPSPASQKHGRSSALLSTAFRVCGWKVSFQKEHHSDWATPFPRPTSSGEDWPLNREPGVWRQSESVYLDTERAGPMSFSVEALFGDLRGGGIWGHLHRLSSRFYFSTYSTS